MKFSACGETTAVRRAPSSTSGEIVVNPNNPYEGDIRIPILKTRKAKWGEGKSIIQDLTACEQWSWDSNPRRGMG